MCYQIKRRQKHWLIPRVSWLVSNVSSILQSQNPEYNLPSDVNPSAKSQKDGGFEDPQLLPAETIISSVDPWDSVISVFCSHFPSPSHIKASVTTVFKHFKLLAHTTWIYDDAFWAEGQQVNLSQERPHVQRKTDWFFPFLVVRKKCEADVQRFSGYKEHRLKLGELWARPSSTARRLAQAPGQLIQPVRPDFLTCNPGRKGHNTQKIHSTAHQRIPGKHERAGEPCPLWGTQSAPKRALQNTAAYYDILGRRTGFVIHEDYR